MIPASNTTYNTHVKVPCRISYVHIAEPRTGYDGEPRYSCVLIVNKDDEQTLEAINEAMAEAKNAGLSRKWNDSMPETVVSPLKDGDTERPDDPDYRSCYFINAASGRKPVLVDQKANQLTDASRIYSGCYCNVVIDLFPYKSQGSDTRAAACGIAAELESIQLVKEGESLQNRNYIRKWFTPVV